VDSDPRTNVVVFQLNNAADEIVIGHAPTLVEDGVRQAWEGVRHEHGAHPGQVVALHAEWEPSPVDDAFIEATFPQAAVTYNFSRPGDPDGWEEAFAEARATMLKAAEEQASAESGQDQAAGSGEGQAAGRGELLPVLWSESSPRSSMLEAVPHWPVASGRLHLALAVVAPTPRGTIGMHHVTHQQLGDQSFNELMAEACENLTSGLRVNAHQTDNGQLLTLSGTLVSAMVCMPDFYQRLSELTNADRLVVGLPCPDDVYVAAADSPLATVVHRAVHESEYPNTELVPAVLSIEGDHIEVLSEREST
jgi:hypothetical protein